MTMMVDKAAIVDTNILFRAINMEVGLHEETKKLLKRLQDDGYQLWISRQIIREYLRQVTRQGAGGLTTPLPIDVAIAHVRGFHDYFQIANENSRVTNHLLELIHEFPTGGKQIHDANIVATMLAYKIDTLLTLNLADMDRFKSKITIMTP